MCRTSTLIVLGLLLLLVGTLDPLEGWPAILTGSGVVALGAYLSRSEHRGLLACAFALVLVGAAGMIALSAMGGVGGESGRPLWWGLLLVPYAAGWILGLLGAVLWLEEVLNGPPNSNGGNFAPR